MGLKDVYGIVAELHTNFDKAKMVKRLCSIANVRSCLTIIATDKYNASADSHQ